MADNRESDNITGEVSERLDDIFGEDDDEKIEEVEAFEALADDPIQNLKAIVLSIEWEVSDDAMDRFVEEVSSLKGEFRDDRISLLFLQLLGSLGEYIRSNKGDAHPNSFKLLNKVFGEFEDVYRAGDSMSGLEKKRVLSAQLASFKNLKEQIATKKAAAKATPDAAKPAPVEDLVSAPVPPKPVAPPAPAQPEEEVSPPAAQDAFQQAVMEIKEMIRSEFKALRDEIKQLRGGA